MKLKELAKELKAQYVSYTSSGKTVTHYFKHSLNADEEIPKGASIQYNDGKGWKDYKGGRK